MTEDEKMEAWLNYQPKDVRENVTVVDGASIAQLHMSFKKVRNYIPSVPRRAAVKEDTRVSRVSVATNLWGMFVGYAETIDDFLYGMDGWLGGYYIYKFDVPLLLIPNKKLLYDVKETNEHWIVPYKPELETIKPKMVGTFFITKVTYGTIKVKDKLRSIDFTAVIECMEEFPLTTDILLSPGHYRFTGDALCRSMYGLKLDDKSKWKPYTLEKISKAEYMDEKRISASMLSLNPLTKPASLEL